MCEGVNRNDVAVRIRQANSTALRCEQTCGDGLLAPGEQCDDGNKDRCVGQRALCVEAAEAADALSTKLLGLLSATLNWNWHLDRLLSCGSRSWRLTQG